MANGKMDQATSMMSDMGQMGAAAYDQTVGTIFGLIKMAMDIRAYHDTKQTSARTPIVMARALNDPGMAQMSGITPLDAPERQEVRTAVGSSGMFSDQGGMEYQNVQGAGV